MRPTMASARSPAFFIFPSIVKRIELNTSGNNNKTDADNRRGSQDNAGAAWCKYGSSSGH